MDVQFEVEDVEVEDVEVEDVEEEDVEVEKKIEEGIAKFEN